MLSENAFEQLPAKIEQRLTAINTEYLEMIGKRIKEIGTVSATDIHRLNQLREFGSDVDVIIKKLADVSDKNVDEINRIFEYVAKDGYTDAEIFYKATKTPYVPYSKNTILRDYVSAIAKQTANSYKNLSNTTAIGFRVKNLQGETVYKGLAETYKEVIDKAIYEASMGLTDYNSAMRSTLKELADSGIRVVDYKSGYSKRMDSAVRQNILDGIREVNQGVQQKIGKEIKSDGVEISAHFNPAPDHAPYQGRQYTHEEFQQLNDSLARRIGTLNCMHYTHEIILGISQPAYSDNELQDILEKSKVKKMFDGKEYTPYEATQLQRKIETAVRAAKDRAVIAKASGDDLLRRQEQARITKLKNKYKELSDTFDLPVRTERMVVSGFRPVKAIKSAPEYPQNILKFEKGIISQSYETAGLFTPDGKLIFKKDGSKNTVEFFGEEVGYMKGNILTHNHPSGSPFSDFDIFTFVQAQLREIRAAGKQYTYSFSYKKYDINKLYSLDDFMPVWREAITNTYNKFDPEKLPASEFNHQCLVELSHLTGWVYRRIPYHD